MCSVKVWRIIGGVGSRGVERCSSFRVAIVSHGSTAEQEPVGGDVGKATLDCVDDFERRGCASGEDAAECSRGNFDVLGKLLLSYVLRLYDSFYSVFHMR